MTDIETLDFATHFENAKEKETKGFSGSRTLQSSQDGKWYQVKYSTRHKVKLEDKVKARLKGNAIDGATDHENIGELVAGEIAKSMQSVFTKSTALTSPDISFVGVDEQESKDKKAGIKIASKFISDFADLAGVYKDKSPLEADEEIRYLKVNFNSEDHKVRKRRENKEGVIEYTVELGGRALPEKVQKGISDGIAMNALFGNADVNAGGNMGVQVTRNEEKKITAIHNAAILDFGHGFNNLIQGSSLIGGGVKEKNGILDFINRGKVLNFPRGSKSKLWRDYEGLIPSEMFVSSLKKISRSEVKGKMIDGINLAQSKLLALNKEYRAKGVDTGLMKASLQRLNRNVGKKNVKYKNMDDLIDKTMNNLYDFCEKRRVEAKKVAQIMDLQLKIAQNLDKPKELAELKKEFKKISPNGKAIRWVRETAQNPARKMTFDNFVKAKKAELFKVKEQEKIVRVASAAKEIVGELKSGPAAPQKMRSQRQLTAGSIARG